MLNRSPHFKSTIEILIEVHYYAVDFDHDEAPMDYVSSLRQLRAVVEAGSFTRAAGMLGVAAPAIALHGGCGEAQITFYCLKPDDPQLQRPKFRAEANQRIEIQQK